MRTFQEIREVGIDDLPVSVKQQLLHLDRQLLGVPPQPAPGVTATVPPANSGSTAPRSAVATSSRDAFPYDNHIIYQDFAPLHYDSGDYGSVLDKALDAIGYHAFIAVEQPQLRTAGRRVGIGIVCYVEGTGIGPYEGARIQVQGSGRVLLATGIGTQGQGHFTSLAQIIADEIGVAVSNIDVVTGDTDQFHWGVGTSRAAPRWWRAALPMPRRSRCALRSCAPLPSIGSAPRPICR